MYACKAEDAIKLSTLDAICNALNCQPGNILEFRKAGSK